MSSRAEAEAFQRADDIDDVRAMVRELADREPGGAPAKAVAALR